MSLIRKILPEGTEFKFISLRKPAAILSGLLAIASIVFFMSQGLNYGIDFKGGTLIEVKSKDGPANISELRGKIGKLNLGDIEIQEFGSPEEVLIRVEQQKGGEASQQNAVTSIKKALGDSVEYRRVEVVGPKVSGELVESGTLAVLVAIFAVLLYIWFRFEWQFSLGAVLALVHDIIITIGVFSALKLEFNLSIVAALLTIVGYSLNDTVVVYDRIRENFRKYKKMELAELLNLSLNQTLSRTILTSVTTLIALLSLYIFGGEVIRGFTFAMIWGVIIGTYSSIFIAAPVLILLKVKRDWSGGGPKPKEKPMHKEGYGV